MDDALIEAWLGFNGAVDRDQRRPESFARGLLRSVPLQWSR